MRPLIHEITTAHTPESLATRLTDSGARGLVLLRSAGFDSTQARYSFVAANPFLTFRSSGSQCEVTSHLSPLASSPSPQIQFGNPWHLLDALMSRYELLDEIDLPFPLGGCFGYWGYDLKNFTEPKLPRRAVNDLELPDCHVGFYDSLVVFDHRLGKTNIVATGLGADGSRTETRASEQLQFWKTTLQQDLPQRLRDTEEKTSASLHLCASVAKTGSNLTREEFISKVIRAQRYIRAGDIYQVNLSQRLAAQTSFSGWEFFERLLAVSPAPFAAFLDCGDFQVASSSP